MSKNIDIFHFSIQYQFFFSIITLINTTFTILSSIYYTPSVTARFFPRFIIIIYYEYLYVFVCDYLSLCVFYPGLVDFGLTRVF